MDFSSKQLSGKYAQLLEKAFGLPDIFLEYNPGQFVMTRKFGEIAGRIFDLEIKPDDVWTISYPRTGSTWCQELVWLIGNNLDYESAKNQLQHFRAPIVEFSSVLITDEYSNFMKQHGDSVDLVKSTRSPRFIKTHLTSELLPTAFDQVKPKMIYVARNPKDLVVSYFHYLQLVHNLKCTFEEFCELFMNGMVPFGSVWSHYLGFWKKRDDPNVLFLKYEDMKRNLRKVILQVAAFLEKQFTVEQIDELMQYLDFDNMKNNRSVNIKPILETRTKNDANKNVEFIRNGVIGDWKNHMNKDLSNKFDDWIQCNIEGTGLTFN